MTSASGSATTRRMYEIPVLYEDPFLLAVNKPAGLPTQAGHDPRRPNLFARLQEQRGEKLFLHHRLDKDTSGVLILSRDPRANKSLTETFREHRLNKVYRALTKKKEAPLAEWTAQDHLAPVRGPGQKLMRMVQVKSGGWAAETRFRLLQTLAFADYWEALPKTGRTHQIRVHLASAKRPILGDFLYGGKSSEVPRLMLHAFSLELPHPVSGANLRIEAPVPADFISLLKKWS